MGTFSYDRSTAAPPTSITLDGSYGQSGNITATGSNIFQITPNMGRAVGTNLFQSFGTFDLGTGDTASFTVNAGTQNIVARVTGGSASSIDGTVSSPVNLFFLNPAGVMFGANAQINVAGSLVISTADYVKLGTDGIYYAQLGSADNLTTSPISAFGFLNPAPRPVTFSGTQLTTQSGMGLHVIAGDITLDQGSTDGTTERGAMLNVPNGNLTLFSAASAGEVPFSLASPGTGFASATNPAFGTVSVQHSSILAITGDGGGSMVIRSGKLVAAGQSDIQSINNGTAGGAISVQSGDVEVDSGAQLASFTVGSARGGDVTINADTVTVDGEYQSGADTKIAAETDGPGHAGNLTITAADSVDILSRGAISTVTRSSGDSGDLQLTVNSGNLNIDGADPSHGGAAYLTGVFGGAISNSTGSGGKLTLNVNGNVTIEHEGQISAVTHGTGDAGSVLFTANSLSIDGTGDTTGQTGIFSNAGSSTAPSTNPGNAGSVDVTVNGPVELKTSGNISSSTYTDGAGGDVSLEATDLTIDGVNDIAAVNAGVFAETHGAGAAGNLTVTVSDAIQITDKGAISASTFAGGHGGVLDVTAASLSIDGAATSGSNVATGIFAIASKTSTGFAGTLSVNISGALTLNNGGGITALTNGAGQGGDATITAGSIHIGDQSEIDTNSTTNANAGNITVTASSLTIDGTGDRTGKTGILSNSGSSSAPSATTGTAGSISVTVNGQATLETSGFISSSTYTNGAGGNVYLHATGLTINGAGDVAVNAGVFAETHGAGDAGVLTVKVDDVLQIVDRGAISVSTFAAGQGGLLTVDAGSLSIDGATHSAGRQLPTGIFAIASTTSTGKAGTLNVTVAGDATLTNDARISALTNGTNPGGNVDVTAGTLHITSAALVASNSTTNADAGTITVQADDLSIDGTTDPTGQTGIVSNSSTNSATTTTNGKAGSVDVAVQCQIEMTGFGTISTNTYSDGTAGDVTVSAGSVGLANGANISSSSLGTASAAGNGGNVTLLVAGNADLRTGSDINATSLESHAGSVSLQAAGTLTLESGSSINTSAGTSGGNIALNVGRIVYLLDGSLSAAASTVGGNIKADPQFVVLDDGNISANAPVGQGGDITISTDNFLLNQTPITATGNTDGIVTISAPELDLSGSLLSLPEVLVDNEKRLRETCSRVASHEFSTLIVVGRGGTEAGPQELQADFGLGALPWAAAGVMRSR